MENNFLIYVSKTVPLKIGVKNPDAVGEIVKLVFDAEKNGNQKFAHENFKTARDRAEMLTPYNIPSGKEKEHEHCLNVIECAILNHRINKHNEDHAARVMELKSNTLLTETEKALLSTKRDFWN